MIKKRNHEIDKILKEISLLTFKDQRVVQKVAYHPLFFLSRMIMDLKNNDALRIAYFGLFVQKGYNNKERLMFNRYARLVNNYKELYEVFKESYPECQNAGEFKNLLGYCYENKDYDSLEFIRKRHKYWKKHGKLPDHPLL